MQHTGLAILSAFALVLSPIDAQRDEEDPRLEQARELLRAGDEPQVRSGAEMCADVDTPAAAELLLEVLGETLPRGGGYLPPPHYRDIAWEGLERLEDPYARGRVAVELDDNKDDPYVRQWCAELLGPWGDGEFGDELVGALSDRDDGVRRAAARSLGQMRYPPGAKNLKKLAKVKDPELRSNAIEALARIDPAEHGSLLVAAIAGDKDGGVRCALLGALPEILPEQVEEVATAALADEDWRARLQATDDLGSVRTKSAVDALIGAIEDERPVVGLRAVSRLQELTGEKHTRPDVWQSWWSDNRETFEFPEGRAQADVGEHRSVASYNGVRVTSDHVAFLIDKSQAMTEPLKSRGTTKEEAARQELEQVLGALEGRLVFNLLTYEQRVEVFSKRPVELTKKTAKRALAFEEKQRPSGRKDVWAVLESVVTDPEIDTVYLLSSGEPDIGLYVHWNRLTAHLADINRFQKVVVHTIAYSDSQWYRDQLQKISEATGGEFIAFE